METFNFCPLTLVPETIPREGGGGITLNAWQFSSKPTAPYQRKFKVKLYGLMWYLGGSDLYDATTDATHNARALETFYQRNETWNPFTWVHPHLGSLIVRFAAPLNVPAALPNSGGRLDSVEVTFVEYNPGY